MGQRRHNSTTNPNNMNALVYDIEIIKAVPDKKSPMLEGIEYCKGWDDHASMGISCIGAYDYATDRYRVFCKDNMEDFRALQSGKLMVSFNGIGFDNKVIALQKFETAGFDPIVIEPDRCYDVLAELWVAAGLGREFVYPTHIGFGLGDVGYANFKQSKTGTGGLAPVEWQRGNIGNVVDYCLNDVRLTKRCFDRIRQTGGLRDPRDSSRFLEMERPKL